jgi:hypothetical protein
MIQKFSQTIFNFTKKYYLITAKTLKKQPHISSSSNQYDRNQYNNDSTPKIHLKVNKKIWCLHFQVSGALDLLFYLLSVNFQLPRTAVLHLQNFIFDDLDLKMVKSPRFLYFFELKRVEKCGRLWMRYRRYVVWVG